SGWCAVPARRRAGPYLGSPRALAASGAARALAPGASCEQAVISHLRSVGTTDKGRASADDDIEQVTAVTGTTLSSGAHDEDQWRSQTCSARPKGSSLLLP